ncbi:MAG: hypothetical protein WC437_02930 [Patescibacteria group bacterium]
MKKQKISFRQKIIDQKLLTASFVIGCFLIAMVLVPAGELAKTVITKKPVALAAGTCNTYPNVIFSAWNSSTFTGTLCSSGTLAGLDTGYSTGAIKYTCGGTICYLGKSCRICSYGSGDPCGWVDNFYNPTDYRPCGGNHISTYNCGDPTISGCGDAFCGQGVSGVPTSTPPGAGRCKSNNTAGAVTLSEGQYSWQCTGPKGHTIGCGAPQVINGSCGASHLSCAAGTASDTPADTSCSYNWTCVGVNGTSPQCSAAKTGTPGTNGSCGASTNTCNSGTFVDTADGSCTYNWSCQGTAGTCGAASGATSNCSTSKPVTNGACGTANKTYAASATNFGADTFCSSGTASPANPTFPAAGSSTGWSCTGSCGGATASCTATRLSSAPTCALTPSPANISSGGSSTISWTTTNGTSLTINSVSKTPVASGSMSTGALTATTTYTGSVTGPGGTGACSTTVNVIPAPTCSITATPPSVLEGDSSTLSWSTTNAVDFKINGAIKTLPSGSQSTGALAATTVYNGIVTNSAGGTANCSATVTVSPRCSITSFTATTTPGSGDVTPFTASSPVNNLYFYAKGSRVNSYKVWLGKTSPTASPADPADITLPNGTLNTVTNTAVGSNTDFTSPDKILTQYNAYIYGYTGANYTAPQCSATLPITIQGATCSINSATITADTASPTLPNVFSVSPFKAYTPIDVILSGTYTNTFPDPILFMWDFDKAVSTGSDSQTYSSVSVNHRYDNPNIPFQSITAVLSGKLDNGYVCDSTKEVSLELHPQPGLTCKVAPGDGSSPLVVKVDYVLTGINGALPYTMSINTGDGSSTLNSLSGTFYHTYKLPAGTTSGNYSIKMSASGTDMGGAAKSYTNVECGSSPVKVQTPKSGERGGEIAP